MKLRKLSIEQLAGLPSGLRLEPEHLSGRIQVLHGPNEIGKSSIVRALKALLWPREARVSGHVQIEGQFEIHGVEWIARREGALTRWTRGGLDVPAPQLLPFEHAHQLLIGLEDLGLGREGDIQAHVQLQLGGGYDIAKVEATFGPQSSRSKADKLERAERALKDARSAQEALLRDWDSLESARRARDEANKAVKRVAILQSARDLALARRKAEETKAALDGFPAGIELLRGNEAEKLVGLRKTLDAARADVVGASSELAAIEDEIASLDLAFPVAPEVLAELNLRVEELRNADLALGTAEDQCVRADALLAAAAEAFAPDADLDRLASLDEGLARAIDKFTRESQAHEAEHAAIRGELSARRVVANREHPAVLAIAALQEWLTTPPAASPEVRARAVPLWTLILLLLVALGVAIHQGDLGLIGTLVLALGAAAFTAIRSSRSHAGSTGPTRADREAAYSRTGEGAPASWTEIEVRAQLDRLNRRHLEAIEAEVQARPRTDLEAKLRASEAKAEELAQQRARLGEQLDVTADSPDGLLIATLRAREALRDARSEQRAAAAVRNQKTEARKRVLLKLNEPLANLGVPNATDFAMANSRVFELGQKSRRLESLRKARIDKTKLLRDKQNSSETCDKAIDEFFRDVGLKRNEEEELDRRLDLRASWKSAHEAHTKAEREVEILGPRVPAELRAAPLEDIDEQVRSTEALATSAADLVEGVTKTETRLNDALAGCALQEALAAREACRAELKSDYEAALRRELARALLADVRRVHEYASRPPLVVAADRLFLHFTQGRHGLISANTDGEAELRASDTDNATRTLALDELSDGTRAQLLLAARLAYLSEVEERGNPMPVVLDDALATSDPERIQQIGAALLSVAREQGRQFLVLTTERRDADLLRPKDAAPGEVEPTDLVAVRRLRAPTAAHEHLRLLEVPRVPEPGDLTAEGYALSLEAAGLKVRSIEPHRPVSELHLWWVLRHDLALLARMLEHRLDNVGKLRNATHLSLAFFGERERAAVEPWIVIATSVIDAWRVGRGRPIDRDVLERAGVSEDFLERMTSLAADLRGDAKAWLAAVRARHDERAKRYRKEALESNREFLIAEGYLDELRVLDREEAWMRVLASLPAGHGIGGDALRARFELLWRACGT